MTQGTKPGDVVQKLNGHQKARIAECIARRPYGCGMSMTQTCRIINQEMGLGLKPTRANMEFMGAVYCRDPEVQAVVEGIARYPRGFWVGRPSTPT